MMTNAFNKEIKRSITKSIGRFLAIAIIAALGCGFFAGLRMTSIDMDLSADIFYDNTRLSDLYVTSSLGLDDADVDRIAEVEGVEAVAAVKIADAYAIIGDSKYVARFNSIDLVAARESDTSDGASAVGTDDSYINRPILVEGAWPQVPGECVIAADAVLDSPVEVGDVITVVGSGQSDDDALVQTQYIVTGLVRSSYYLMTSNFGSSSLGAGEIDTYAFIAEEDFSDDVPYSGAYVIVDGALEKRYPGEEYDSVVDAVMTRLEGKSDDLRVMRLSDIKEQAQSKLDDARAEYDSSYASAMDGLSAAEQELSAAKEKLDESMQTLSDSETKLEDAYEKIVEGEKQLESNAKTLEEKQAQLDASSQELEEKARLLDTAKQEAEARFAREQAKVDMIPDATLRGQAQAALEQERAKAQAEFDGQSMQLNVARAQVEEGQAQLDDGKAQYAQAAEELKAGRASYESGRAKLADGHEQYRSGLAEYQNGLVTYESNKARALEELAEARSELDDAQADIDELELPDFYFLNRGKNVGVAGHEADASRIDQIAQVFPLIFFLVAALVVLTTMTRMVDEERMLIGTYKALGYSNARIISKYLIYALVASGVGSVVGILLLSQFLPQLIMQAYSIIYALPVCVSPLDPAITILAICLSVGITLIATWFAAYSSLRERPALLMLPRAPKPGKRILLERMGFIWKHLSFSSKVTARNLFRYKRRFLMAIIGIAGCTALLLTGLGLRDGINDIIDKQFGELQHFNLEIQMSDEQDLEDARRVQAILGESSIVSETMRIARESVLATSPNSDTDIRASVYVPEDTVAFEDFFTLRERIGHARLTLDDEGAIVSEKLASELGVGTGETIEVYEQSAIGERSGTAHEMRIAGIMEFYTGQRIFMTPEYYEQVMGTPCNATDIISKAEAPLDERSELANQILDVDGVEVVSYYDEIIDTYRTMLETVNAVVWVLIIAAALLAFVVIYNLTNINITERTREIATLKVLGFTPRETNAYIFRETILLTIIGALVGLVLGIWMEGFVVVTAEVNEMMFGREIHLASYLIAFVLTIVFSVIVSLAMMPKIKSIDMVQSLKSVD